MFALTLVRSIQEIKGFDIGDLKNMTDFTSEEIQFGKLSRKGERHKIIAKQMNITDEHLKEIIHNLTAKINTVNDSIDFLTAIGELSGEKVFKCSSNDSTSTNNQKPTKP